MTHRVLIIEDEEILAKNYRRYLQRHDYDARVAASGEAGLEEHERFQPDVILLDHRLPGMDGLEVLDRLRAENGDVRVILITAHGNVQIAVDAMKGGAADYMTKPVGLSELKQVIERTVRDDLAANLTRIPPEENGQRVRLRLETLTKREGEVLKLVFNGEPNKRIAYTLGIDEKTVEFHRANLKKKMGAKSSADLIRMVATGSGPRGQP